MNDTEFGSIVERAKKIRIRYHQVELELHGSEWSVKEDALAFLTDAGAVGRLTMAQQGRWPKSNQTAQELEHKLGECIWWLIVLADRMDIDIGDATEAFLTKTERAS